MILLFISMAVESLGLITCICNLNGKYFFIFNIIDLFYKSTIISKKLLSHRTETLNN